MADVKTKPTDESLDSYLARIPDEARRNDCRTVADIMQAATGQPAVLWGTGIVGFGRYHYKYASGREGECPVTGFASRKTDLVLYIMPSAAMFPELLAKLGKHKTGKACLYIKRLGDVDVPVLAELVAAGVEAVQKTGTE